MNKVKTIAVITMLIIFCIVSNKSISMKIQKYERPIYEILAKKDAEAFAFKQYERIYNQECKRLSRKKPTWKESKIRRFAYDTERVKRAEENRLITIKKEASKLIKLYKSYENELERLKKSKWLKEVRGCRINGGINYLMNLNEMKQKAEEKFISLQKNNLIISKNEFEEKKHDFYVDKPHTNLTRIWGQSI